MFKLANPDHSALLNSSESAATIETEGSRSEAVGSTDVNISLTVSSGEDNTDDTGGKIVEASGSSFSAPKKGISRGILGSNEERGRLSY